METVTVSASLRSTTGKGPARKSRKTGQTPGVLYRSGGTATPINFSVAELASVFRKTHDPNTVVSLALDGSSRSCLVREIQRHPVSRDVIHVDFYEVDADKMVAVDVVVNPVGRALGTRAGGTLRVLARSLALRAPAGRIPSRIDVDVTNLDVGGFVKASQCLAPEGCSIVYKQDFNVLTVTGKQTAAEAAPAEAAAAPAAAAAKAPAKDEKKK